MYEKTNTAAPPWDILYLSDETKIPLLLQVHFNLIKTAPCKTNLVIINKKQINLFDLN